MTQDKLTKRLYKFELECFYTILYGVFVASQQEVQSAIGKTIRFGNADENDSNITELFSWQMLHELQVSEATIEDLLEGNGRGNFTISGYNPLDYLKEEE